MSWLRVAVAVVVTGVWAVGYLLSFFTSAEAPLSVTPVMLAVVGWLFAQELRDQVKARRKVVDEKPRKRAARKDPDE